MRKLLLFVFCVLALGLNAQTIDVLLDGGTFSVISPNGEYLAGNMEDAAVYYNVLTKKIVALEGEVQDDGGCFVWDMNDKGQLAVDWKMTAAIWSEADEFEILPYPEGLTSKEKRYSAARCISNDGKYVVVSFGTPTISIYLYTLGEDGIYTMEKMALPEIDPIYNQIPQYIAPCGMTDDGNRILCRYRVESAEFELPFVIERTSAGENWSIRWIAPEFIVEGGKTNAEFYGAEFEFDGDPFEDPEGFEAAYNEWLQNRENYYATIDAVSTGYFYEGIKGDLSGLAMSKNGKYAKMQISYEDVNDVVSSYPCVIDLETEQVYVFTCLADACCLSVTNDGLVSLGTPRVDYFRYAHISSIADPTKSQTLTEWTKGKTNGKINLADYMTYETYEGTKVAEGSAILFADGSGFMTYQYNGFGDNQRYETYIVNFGAQAPIDTTNQASLQYCTEDIVSACGQEESQKKYAQSAAIKLTQKQLLTYKGNYVIKMLVGLAAHETWTPEIVSGMKYWIRESLNGENLWEQDYDVSKVVFGAWNELVFDNFYAIDGSSDLYFGYTIECGGLPIGGDGNSASSDANATWVYDCSSNKWIQYSNCGNFSIKVYIAGENMPEYNLSINALRTAEFARTDSKFDAVANISNTIDKEVNSFDFVIYANDKEVYRKTEELAESLKNGDALNIFFKDIQLTEEGSYNLIYTIENINGENSDDNEIDSRIEIATQVSDEFEDKVVMLEMFSGTMNSTSHTGYNYLHNAIDELGEEKYVWAIHHAGYNTSEFTLDESNDAVAFFGSSMTYAPGTMLDRVNLLEVGVTSITGAIGPVFSVNEVGSRNVLEDYMKVIQKNMSPIRLDVQHTIDTLTRNLVVIVEGELLGDFDVNTLRIGAITLEDSILRYQAGVGENYVHNHIIRSFMTSAYGDEIMVENGRFSIEFTQTLNEKFVLENMSIAVWVGRNATLSDINGFEIYQAYQEDLVVKTQNPEYEEVFALYAASENPEMGGVKIILMAEAIEGFEFVEWSDGNTVNPRIIELTEDTELYARFRVIGETTDVENSKISVAEVYSRDGVLYVEGAEGDYHVLDMAGRLIYSGRKSALNLPRGVYLVTIAGEVEKVVL